MLSAGLPGWVIADCFLAILEGVATISGI